MLFNGIMPNPTTAVVDSAWGLAQTARVDLVLALGGGSSIDVAKAVGLFAGLSKIEWRHWFATLTDPFADHPLPAPGVLPVIAVTTTSGTGSHVTQAMVISRPEDREKACLFHAAAFPRQAIVDPELMLSLPPRMTAVTGFDAFSHAFESYLSDRCSHFVEVLAEEAIRTIVETLPSAVSFPHDLDLRARLAEADTLAGVALANAGAGVPHPLSELVGGSCSTLAHGACLAALYPAYTTFLTSRPSARTIHLAEILAEASRWQDRPPRLEEIVSAFIERIGLTSSLSALGCTSKHLARTKRSPILDALPWASRSELEAVLDASF